MVTPDTAFILHIVQRSATGTSYMVLKPIVGIYLSNLYDGVFLYAETIPIDPQIISNH